MCWEVGGDVWELQVCVLGGGRRRVGVAGVCVEKWDEACGSCRGVCWEVGGDVWELQGCVLGGGRRCMGVM